MKLRVALAWKYLAVTALFASAFVVFGCFSAGAGRISYESLSVDAPNPRYEYPPQKGGPRNLEVGLYGPSPTGVYFDMAGVSVAVATRPDSREPFDVLPCERGLLLGILGPIPALMPTSKLVIHRNFVISVRIRGEKVSVDPNQIVLQDQTGTVINRTFLSKEYGNLVEFAPPCSWSGTYDLVLGGVAIDGRTVEMPTVHFERGSMAVLRAEG